jgi:hypothetical protein
MVLKNLKDNAEWYDRKIEELFIKIKCNRRFYYGRNSVFFWNLKINLRGNLIFMQVGKIILHWRHNKNFSKKKQDLAILIFCF